MTENTILTGFNPAPSIIGTFAGICAQGMTGDEVWAHFTEFNMTPGSAG